MGSRIWLPATVAALSLTLAACGGSDELVGAPDEGTCWTVPADDDPDTHQWFDDSPTVPCTEPHTSETVSVLPLTEPTIAEAKETAAACWEEVIAYLGVDSDHWVHWSWAAFLPSREQIADGASWLRCDAVFPAWDLGSPVRSTTYSAAGAAVDPPAELWACLDEHPKNSKQSFVPCDQPHKYEQTGGLAILLVGLDHQYPSPAELAATAEQQCAEDLDDEESDVGLTARWDPPSWLRESSEVAGACFMFEKTGQPLAPRQ